MVDFAHKCIWSAAGNCIRLINHVSYPLQKQGTNIIRFNTAQNTDNLGDYIIMRYCESALSEMFPGRNFVDVPTHTSPSQEQEEQVRKAKLKFVCGTNLLTSHVEEHWNWILPDGLRRKMNYRNIILMGVGWKNYEEECSDYSRMIYKAMLAPSIIHSVRDSYTERMLNNAGIHNVVNTGCPTTWNLTSEFCSGIPEKKARDVITTVTDYRRDLVQDNLMLEILGRCYEHVYLWLQGNADFEYLRDLKIPRNLSMIPASLDAYEEHLTSGEVDYVGTRLHAGIFALNHRVRSVIIAVDNRATEISRDTALPIIRRDDIGEKLEERVVSDLRTDIHINQNNINLFKSQFQRLAGST